jgi:hypothetical protein
MNDEELSRQIMSSALPSEILPSEFCWSSLNSLIIPDRRGESSRYNALPIASHVRRSADRRPDATERLLHASNATPYLISSACTSEDMTPSSPNPELERDYKAQNWAFPVRFAPQYSPQCDACDTYVSQLHLSQHGASDFDWHASGEALRGQIQADTSESVKDFGGTVPPAVRKARTKMELAARISEVSPQSIGQKLHMTQKQAAYEFGLGLTTFKKTCSLHVLPWSPPALSLLTRSHCGLFPLRTHAHSGQVPTIVQ